jgi:hypothetical protein
MFKLISFALITNQNSTALILSYCCHHSKQFLHLIFLQTFLFSYYSYQEDERAKPGNLLTK